jgi:hypothetical protein
MLQSERGHWARIHSAADGSEVLRRYDGLLQLHRAVVLDLEVVWGLEFTYA